MASPLDAADPALQKLVETIESSLMFLVRQPMTREQAIEIRQKINRPMGVLGSAHNLSEDRKTRRSTYQVRG